MLAKGNRQSWGPLAGGILPSPESQASLQLPYSIPARKADRSSGRPRDPINPLLGSDGEMGRER